VRAKFGRVGKQCKDARPINLPHRLTFNHQHNPTMADPSGAAPQPGPDDVATAILRPKKSYVDAAQELDCSLTHR